VPAETRHYRDDQEQRELAKLGKGSIVTSGGYIAFAFTGLLGRSGFEQPVLERVVNELGPRSEPQLLLNARSVSLDGANREVQLLADLGVGVAERDHPEHLDLALRETVGWSGGGSAATRAPRRGFR